MSWKSASMPVDQSASNNKVSLMPVTSTHQFTDTVELRRLHFHTPGIFFCLFILLVLSLSLSPSFFVSILHDYGDIVHESHNPDSWDHVASSVTWPAVSYGWSIVTTMRLSCMAQL